MAAYLASVVCDELSAPLRFTPKRKLSWADADYAAFRVLPVGHREFPVEGMGN